LPFFADHVAAAPVAVDVVVAVEVVAVDVVAVAVDLVVAVVVDLVVAVDVVAVCCIAVSLLCLMHLSAAMSIGLCTLSCVQLQIPFSSFPSIFVPRKTHLYSTKW